MGLTSNAGESLVIVALPAVGACTQVVLGVDVVLLLEVMED